MTDGQRLAGRGAGDREYLASALKQARQAAGLTGAAAGKAAGFGQSKLSKIERMALLPTPDDVDALCRAYQFVAAERKTLVDLAKGLRQEQSAKVILSRQVGSLQQRIRELEGSASVVRSFQPVMVLGILQTEAYAQCVFSQPDSSQLDEAQVIDATRERIARKVVLGDSTKQLRLVLTEGALRWHAASPELMATQLDAIQAVVGQPNVQLGIIPWTTPVRFFPRHGFHVYDADAVMVGTETATATMTGAADVSTYLELFTALEEVASYGDAACGHLERIAHEFRSLPTG